MYVLDKLWRGEVQPAGYDPFPDKAKSAQLRHNLCQQREQLLSLLDDEGKRLLDEITNAEMELNNMEEESCFRYGFQLAVQLILDGVAG